MSRMKKTISLFSVLLAAMLIFSACQSDEHTQSLPDGSGDHASSTASSAASPASNDPAASSDPALSGGQDQQDPSGGKDQKTPGTLPAFTVKPAEWSNIEWTRYESPYFTLQIPKGWEVTWQGNAQQLQWIASVPGKLLGVCNLDHRYAAKDYRWYMQGGSDLYLVNGSVEEFFSAVYANSTDYFTVKNSVVPSNYALMQSVRPYDPIHDYRSLYAIFSENGVEGEGLYSALVANSKDVWVGGMNYGMWEVDCIVTEWAPRGELVNWYPIMHQIMQSFAYTSYYLQEWRSVLGTDVSPDASSSSVGDSVVESFEERDRADTILQEKRSDMIGEYERVYDNEDGKIYRAWNGFLEDIGEQSRYTAITDDQYADGFAGWIEK